MKKSNAIFACILSAATGSAITYIFTKKYFQKKLEGLGKTTFLTGMTTVSDTPEPIPKISVATSEWITEWDEAMREQLNKYSSVDNSSDKTVDTTTEENDISSLDPYVTTDEEFMASEEKMYFTVYKDGVIADDTDKVIRNPEHYLGKDITDSLLTKNGDDPMYVCNPTLDVAIEIGFSLDDYS